MPEETDRGAPSRATDEEGTDRLGLLRRLAAGDVETGPGLWSEWARFGPGRARAMAVAGAIVVLTLVGAGAVLVWRTRPDPAARASLTAVPFAGSTGSSASSGSSGSAPDPTGGDDPGPPGPTDGSSTSPEGRRAEAVVVHVAGAVAQPGVYRLDAGARVDDALARAGGPSAEADLGRVNLAAPVADGTRIYVPRQGEAAVPEVVDSAGPPPEETRPGSGGTRPVRVNINRAGPQELEALPGVGPSTAAAIVTHRQQHGPFRRVEDLTQVRGIGPAKLDQLRPLVTVS